VPSSVVGVSLPISSVLTDVIMSKLDCKEQQKAATATTEAVRGGVGASSTWKSDTRAGVSGSSTVTGQQTRADGATCLTETDIVIVNGEETRAPKKMCRSPGGGNYVVAV
jgi:hypothetical protein